MTRCPIQVVVRPIQVRPIQMVVRQCGLALAVFTKAVGATDSLQSGQGERIPGPRLVGLQCVVGAALSLLRSSLCPL